MKKLMILYILVFLSGLSIFAGCSKALGPSMPHGDASGLTQPDNPASGTTTSSGGGTTASSGSLLKEHPSGKYYVLGGDMLLDKEDPYHKAMIDQLLHPEKYDTRVVRDIRARKWPANFNCDAAIPYYIDGYINKASDIRLAMNEWENSMAGKICFIDVGGPSQYGYVLRIYKDYSATTSSATLGYTKEAEFTVDSVRDDGPESYYGAALHELGHVLGLMHEHQRFYRNNSIAVYYNNLSDYNKNVGQFIEIPWSYAQEYGQYDYDSIMNYTACAMTKYEGGYAKCISNLKKCTEYGLDHDYCDFGEVVSTDSEGNIIYKEDSDGNQVPVMKPDYFIPSTALTIKAVGQTPTYNLANTIKIGQRQFLSDGDIFYTYQIYGDSTPPVVSINSPTTNTLFNGNNTIEINANFSVPDNDTIRKVELYVVGEDQLDDFHFTDYHSLDPDNCIEHQAEYVNYYNQSDSFFWKPSGVSSGKYLIIVSAWDNAGNIGWATIEIRIDVVPPTINPLNPKLNTSDGIIVNNTTPIKLEVKDDYSGVKKVEYWINGIKKNELSYNTSNIYEYLWDTTEFENETSVEIKIVSEDNAGNSTDKKINVIVINGPEFNLKTVSNFDQGGKISEENLVNNATFVFPPVILQKDKDTIARIATFRIENLGIDPVETLKLTGTPPIFCASNPNYFVRSQPTKTDLFRRPLLSDPVGTPVRNQTDFQMKFTTDVLGPKFGSITILNNDVEKELSKSENPYLIAFAGSAVQFPPQISVSVRNGSTEVDIPKNGNHFMNADAFPATEPLIAVFNIKNTGGKSRTELGVTDEEDPDKHPFFGDDLKLTDSSRLELESDDLQAFRIIKLPDSKILPGAASQFAVEYYPNKAGERYLNIRIRNNSENTPDFQFTLKVTGRSLKPVITVQPKDNSSTPISGSYALPTKTTVYPGVEPATTLFTIKNSGGARRDELGLPSSYPAWIGDNLELTGNPLITLSGPDAKLFSVVKMPELTQIAPGGVETIFGIQFHPNSPGTKSVTVTIPNNSLGEPDFQFTLTAEAVGLYPEIHIKSKDLDIPTGGTYNFATTYIYPGIEPSSALFTLENLGGKNRTELGLPSSYTEWVGMPLNLKGNPVIRITGKDADQFSVTKTPATIIESHQSTVFALEFHPKTAGLKEATITIENDDFDEGSYTFTVKGRAEGLLPELNVKYQNQAVPSGPDTTLDLGAVETGPAVEPEIFIFTLENLGGRNRESLGLPSSYPEIVGDNLILSGTPRIEITGPNANLFRVVKQPADQITPLGFSKFALEFYPTSSGVKSASITIKSNDPNGNYFFTVTAQASQE